jgi:hypothetical protein
MKKIWMQLVFEAVSSLKPVQLFTTRKCAVITGTILISQVKKMNKQIIECISYSLMHFPPTIIYYMSCVAEYTG